jgi:hypothetical protein
VAHHQINKQDARNECDESFLILSVFRNRSLTSIVLASHLVEARGIQISARTVRRVLHESDLSSYKPVVCSKLTADHRGSRRRFAQHHINWTIQQWSLVMFSDESHFCLRSPYTPSVCGGELEDDLHVAAFHPEDLSVVVV